MLIKYGKNTYKLLSYKIWLYFYTRSCYICHHKHRGVRPLFVSTINYKSAAVGFFINFGKHLALSFFRNRDEAIVMCILTVLLITNNVFNLYV